MPTFKIATWNLERPKMPKSGRSSVKNARIMDILKEINADILVLTETNAVIHPGSVYITCISSNPLPVGQLYDNCIYQEGENRTTIWSKYPLQNRITTSNDDTNSCCALNTSFGIIIVYGAIIGIQGQKKPWFASDLDHVITDSNPLSKNGNFILAGDFNLSFSDNYYRPLADC